MKYPIKPVSMAGIAATGLILFAVLLLLNRIDLSYSSGEETKNILDGLKRGDRVEIILKNGNSFRGEIKIIQKNRVTLDITYDDPDLKSQITFSSQEIKNIESLAELSDEEKKEILHKKQKELEEYKEEAKRLKSLETPPAPTPPIENPSEKTTEEKEKEQMMQLLASFPPEAGWSEAKYEELVKKDSLFRTEKDEAFIANFADWKKACELKAREERRALLKKYPPGKDWNKDKVDEILSRRSRFPPNLANLYIAPTPEEQEFADKFADWEKALVEREEDKKKEEENQKNQPKEETNPSPAPLPSSPESE